MNKSDSERISAVLEKIGYKRSSKIDEADLVVVNACSVRQSAIDRISGLRPKIKNKAKTILTGCILSADKKKFGKLFDYILDIKDLPKWPKILSNQPYKDSPRKNYQRIGGAGQRVASCEYFKIQPNYQAWPVAYVPISSGCNNFCAYCCVPYTRGPEVSRRASEIVKEVKELIKDGYKEIWLLGQNVNSYQSYADGPCVVDFPLLLKMADALEGNFWVRFTSPHPKDFSDKLITALKECSKVTPYLNLPVQAGDNEVLKKMNRPYTIEHYKDLVSKIRRAIPGITLSTDIIVGFPGETKKQFLNSAKLFREIKFDMAYIAQFSLRPGTAAANLRDDVPKAEKKRRENVLTEILKKTASVSNKMFIGKTIKVLPLVYKNGTLIGKSQHYKTVKFQGKKDLIGQFVDIKIVKATNFGLLGLYE